MSALPSWLDRVDHVAIAVHDIEAARDHYTDVLGLRVIGDEIADSPGVRLMYLDAGNTMVQLVQPVRAGAVSDWLDEHGDGLHHVCFAVERIEDVLASIPDQHSAAIFAGGRGRRACFLVGDQFNVKIELTEHQPRSVAVQVAP